MGSTDPIGTGTGCDGAILVTVTDVTTAPCPADSEEDEPPGQPQQGTERWHERNERALLLRRQGLSLRAIGDELGIDHPEKVMRAIRRAEKAEAPQTNQQVVAQVDTLIDSDITVLSSIIHAPLGTRVGRSEHYEGELITNRLKISAMRELREHLREKGEFHGAKAPVRQQITIKTIDERVLAAELAHYIETMRQAGVDVDELFSLPPAEQPAYLDRWAASQQQRPPDLSPEMAAARRRYEEAEVVVVETDANGAISVIPPEPPGGGDSALETDIGTSAPTPPTNGRRP